MAYGEYCVGAKSPDEVDLTDRDLWRQANPGMASPTAHRIGEEAIETESGTLTREGFARERLGIVDLDAEIYSVIPSDAWAGCLDTTHEPVGRLSYALDVSPKGRSCAIACSDGTHLEIVKHAAGTNWVVDACLAKRDEFTEMVLDPSGPANELWQALVSAGIPVREVKSREGVAAAAQFLAAVIERTPRHLGQAELDQAVANADSRDVGDGGWQWDRRRSSVDISPLYAVTLARWAALSHGDPAASVW